VDLNRAGTPLLEIVTEPDMRSADEVVAYLKGLRDVLISQGVCDADMEKGNFRCEPNLSLRPLGQKEFGTKVELKNINSFKFVKDAIEYEIKRQTKVLNEGGKIFQETRLWNLERGETAVMRSKEEAHDYRYFPDPDLVPLKLDQQWVDEFRRSMPELPAIRQQRLIREYGLNEYVATVLTMDKATVEYFEAITTAAEKFGISRTEGGKDFANWITIDERGLAAKAKSLGRELPAGQEFFVSPEHLAELLVKKQKGEISGASANTVWEEMATTGKTASEIIEAKGLKQISDEGALDAIIDDVLAKNPSQVAQFKEGKQQVLGFLVGQVMKASGGKANPGKVNELLKKKLG
jgi:aspartyl-tRNA(Asn)/glutamyl-tRNA(Gln) amidotransferase subunit B